MEKFTKAQDGVSKLPPLTEPNKGQRPSQQPKSPMEMFGKISVRVRVRTKPNKEEQNRQENEKSSSTMESGVGIEPNKGQRPSQQPESIAEMCSKAGILYRTRTEPNKEQRPSQQPESLMERLKNFSAACTNNKGQGSNQVEQKTQPRNKQEEWESKIEPFVKDKTKNPYFMLIQAEQKARENYRTAIESCLRRASNDLEEKVKTEEQRLSASH